MSRKNRNILILYAKRIIGELLSLCLDNERTDISINMSNKEQYANLLQKLLIVLSVNSKNLSQVKNYGLDDIDRFEELMDLIQNKYPKVTANFYSKSISFNIDTIKYELKCYLE